MKNPIISIKGIKIKNIFINRLITHRHNFFAFYFHKMFTNCFSFVHQRPTYRRVRPTLQAGSIRLSASD